MRGRPVEIVGVATLLLGAAACKGERATPDTRANSATPVAGQASVAPTAAPAASQPPVATGLRLGVSRSAEYGSYVSDGNGRALYLLEPKRPGTAGCSGMCKVVWPPLLAGGGPSTASDSSLRANLIGSQQRSDGPPQASYNGHPLYYYIGDGGAGQTNGHGVEDSWGEWYLVNPGGRAVEGEAGRGGQGNRRGRRDR